MDATADVGADVTLVVLDPDATQAELAAALALRTEPWQERFAGRPEQTVPEALADPFRTPFAVASDGAVVGAGVLDADGLDAELTALVGGAGTDPGHAVLLRAFVIAAGHQGRGLGTAAARAVLALAPRAVPGAGAVVLTVNELNRAGLRAYARAGFSDVGQYLGGRAGPQRAMVARCRPGG